MLRVQHSRHGQLPLGSQLLRFMQVAFDPSGTIFAAADQLGNIFIFDIPGNRYSPVRLCTRVQSLLSPAPPSFC